MANKNLKVNASSLKDVLGDFLKSDEFKAIVKQILLELLKELESNNSGGGETPVPPTTNNKKGIWKKVLSFVITYILPVVLGLFTKKKASATTTPAK